MRYRRSPFRFAAPPVEKPPKAVFHVFVDGRQAGPLSESDLKTLIKNGSVHAQTLAWMPGMPDWCPAQNIPAVNKLLLLCKPAARKSEPSPAPLPVKTEHPLLADLRSAMNNLGYKGPAVNRAIDEVLLSGRSVDLGDAIKEVLKRLQ